MTRLIWGAVASLCLLVAPVQGRRGDAPASGNAELAFGLNQEQFIELTVCHLDAVTQAFSTLSRRDRNLVRDAFPSGKATASMTLEASQSLLACIAKKAIPLRPERVKACYPAAGFMPVEVKLAAHLGIDEGTAAQAWASFATDELERSMLARQAKAAFHSTDDEKRTATKAAFHVAECVRFPGASIELDPALLSQAAADWAP